MPVYQRLLSLGSAKKEAAPCFVVARLEPHQQACNQPIAKVAQEEATFIALLHISLRWHDPDQVQRVFSQLLSK
jgi:hypothetical protein